MLVSASRSPLVETRADRVRRAILLPNGAVRTEFYDYAGRLHMAVEPDGSHLNCFYDADGHLREIHDQAGCIAGYADGQALTSRTETLIEQDSAGFPGEIIQRVDGLEWRVQCRWSHEGRLTGIMYPQADDWLHVHRDQGSMQLSCADHIHLTARSGVQFSTGGAILEDVGPPLRRITHFDRTGAAIIDRAYTYDATGRIIRAGEERFEYDSSGRLVKAESPGYVWQKSANQTQDCVFDLCGRRIRQGIGKNATEYKYNAFGQLVAVNLPDGEFIRYLYDGFGRRVARESPAGIEYFILDFDGHLLAVAGPDGKVQHSYLWLGHQCVARIDGIIENTISQTYHRGHAGQLLAVGDANGELTPWPAGDPYGAGAPIENNIPGFGSLFGDSVTGLLYAGTRWLDPATAHFLTPDSWYGRDAAEALPPTVRKAARIMPGGPNRELTSENAYAWCDGDPVNFTDPNGHSWYGLIATTISGLLWEMQLTSIALEMEVINIALEIIQIFPLFRPLWPGDGYWRTSIFNGNWPMASNRLNVPLAIPLNGLLRFHDRGWTLGNVIWVRGSKWGSEEKSSKRDLLICANGADYLGASGEVLGQAYAAKNPLAKGTATGVGAPAAPGAGSQLTGIAVTAPAGVAITHVFKVDDFIFIQDTTTGDSEIRQVKVTGATIVLDAPPLPAAFSSSVEIIRIDQAFVKIAKDESLIGRSVTFIRGNAIHFAKQIPEGFPVDSLTVEEFMVSGDAKLCNANSNTEFALIRMASTADRDLYTSSDFVRLRSGSKYFARNIERIQGSKALILSSALPKPTPPEVYKDIEIVKLTSSGPAVVGQSGTNDRLNAGNLISLRKFDGVTILNTGAGATTERRIVMSLLVDCQVAALPAGLHGSPVIVELLQLNAAKTITGKKTAPKAVTIETGKPEKFGKGDWIRVHKDPSSDVFTTIADIDKKQNATTKVEETIIILTDELPAADFPDATAVNIVSLVAGGLQESENILAPGDHVNIKTEDPSQRQANDILRITLKSNSSVVAVRKIAAAPAVLAMLDSNLPATHNANLTVQRFEPVANTLKTDATAPAVQVRFTVTSPPPPAFIAGDTIQIAGTEEAFGTVFAPPVGTDIILTDPVEYPLDPRVTIRSITATGIKTVGANLGESRVLIPSDPDVDPITHREAFEQHEMRHVFQGALWGPFLLSLPLPWLVSLSTAWSKFGPDVAEITRHVSVGGLDSLVAAAIWGFAGHKSPLDLTGTIGNDLKTISFSGDTPPDQLAELSKDSPINVSKGDSNIYNVVDDNDPVAHTISLRFALSDFSANDAVSVHVSPYEKIRKKVSSIINLNLSALWVDHIPTHWGRILANFLSRDSWFPLGWYPLSLLATKFNEDRLPNEQDAAFHSGDLYTSILISRPSTIFVGQFSAIFAFLHPRNGDVAVTISQRDPLDLLTVELPAGAKPGQVAGAVEAGPGKVRFRENWQIQMSEKVENVAAAFFAASAPGDYILHAPGELPAGVDIAFKFEFPMGFLKLRTITVSKLEVEPSATVADPVFETEEVLFKFKAKDDTAEYRLRYQSTPPPNPGVLNGMRFTAPNLGGSPTAIHKLEITATYPEDHPVFHGPGQLPFIRLTADQRTNFCQELEVNVKKITVNNPGPIQAGKKANFNSSIPPRTVRITSPLPAGAAIPARVIPSAKRGEPNVFFAPNRVTAASNVTLELVFGSGANQKVVALTVVVNP